MCLRAQLYNLCLGVKVKASKLECTWSTYLSKKDDSSKRKLVEHYFPFVKKIAVKLSYKLNNRVLPDELSSYGIDGLYRAIEKFDFERGNKFETYAYTRIRGSMLDILRQQDWVPRSVRINSSKIEKIRQEAQTRLNKKVDAVDILDKLDINLKKYTSDIHSFIPRSVSSIESCVNPNIDNCDNKKDFNQYLVAKNNSSPDSCLVRIEFLNKLIGKRCSILEQKIVYYYYYEGLTMSDISKILNITESRVSQLHKKILKNLKKGIEVNPSYFSEDIVDIIDGCNDSDALF